MELHAVQGAVGIGHGGDGASGSAAGDVKAGRGGSHHVEMAHPDLLRAGEAGEQRVGGIVQFQRRHAVLAFFAPADLAAQSMGHQLLPVADTEDGQA